MKMEYNCFQDLGNIILRVSGSENAAFQLALDPSNLSFEWLPYPTNWPP